MVRPGFDLSKVNTVLYDLDGTLVDTNKLIYESWSYTVKTLTGRVLTDEEIRRTYGEILRDSMIRLMPEIDPEEALEFFRAYQRGIFLERIKLFDGVEETLRILKERGYKNGLVTSRLRASTMNAVRHFNLDVFIDAIVTASDIEVFKPDPAPVYHILDKLGSKPEETVFVGDTIHDIEAGLASGVFTVLVDWSHAIPQDERNDIPAPDAIIEKMQDLLTLVLK